MKPKLLITTDCFLPRWDGIARFLIELIPFLKADFEITVVAPHFSGDLPEIPGIKLVRYPLMKMRFGDIQFSKVNKVEMTKLVAQADIVFNQTIGPIGITAINVSHKLGKPVVSFVHSIDWELVPRAVKRFKWLAQQYVKSLAKRLYNKCTLLMVPSKEVEAILALNGLKTRKTVVQLGVNTDRFMPALMKSVAKKSIGLNPTTKVIGFAGRIGREKDLPTLKKAFRIALRKNLNTLLLIVGKGIEEERLAGKNIILVGATNNVVPYLQAMDIFVMPSLTETTSLATMEAMAAGVAVIATPVGMIKDYIEDGKNGMLFQKGDYKQLAQKLEQLLSNDKKRAELGRNARKTIVNYHKWDDTVNRIKIVLRKALVQK